MFCKRALWLVALLRKKICILRHPMHLRHPVLHPCRTRSFLVMGFWPHKHPLVVLYQQLWTECYFGFVPQWVSQGRYLLVSSVWIRHLLHSKKLFVRRKCTLFSKSFEKHCFILQKRHVTCNTLVSSAKITLLQKRRMWHFGAFCKRDNFDALVYFAEVTLLQKRRTWHFSLFWHMWQTYVTL